MSRNPTFVQALADASQRVVEVAPVADATTMGAGYLAGLASGVWSSFDDIAALWRPAERVEPAGSLDRAQWADAVGRAAPVDTRPVGAGLLVSLPRIAPLTPGQQSCGSAIERTHFLVHTDSPETSVAVVADAQPPTVSGVASSVPA